LWWHWGEMTSNPINAQRLAPIVELFSGKMGLSRAMQFSV